MRECLCTECALVGQHWRAACTKQPHRLPPNVLPSLTPAPCATVVPAVRSAITVYYIENQKRQEVAKTTDVDCNGLQDVGNKTLVVRGRHTVDNNVV
jgi:hypothetical protein